tara:strand:+ start:407 stop:1465 length:1059 start_codon:yes stop_codon:yes gene_type:complete
MPYLGNTAGNRFVAAKAATQFSGDGSTTAFTLEHSVGSDEDILVSVDGVIQEPSVAYAVSNGTTLTFTAAPSNNSGNNIFVYYLFRTVGTVSHPNNGALSASTGTFTGDVTVDTDTLKVDSSNDRVGIGNDTPLALLDIKGSTDSFAGMAKVYLTDSNSNSDSRNWSVGNGGSAYGTLTISKSKVKDGNPSASGTADNTLMIDNAGRVTMPLQPHFQARSNAGNNGNTWETGQVIKFQTVAVNQGSHYSTSTGRFTAPVAGFYQFNFVGFGYDGGAVGTTTVSVNLLINGSGYIMIAYENNSNGSGNTYPAVSASSAVYLSANDHVSIYVQNSGIYADSSNLYTAFSGFLVA